MGQTVSRSAIPSARQHQPNGVSQTVSLECARSTPPTHINYNRRSGPLASLATRTGSGWVPLQRSTQPRGRLLLLLLLLGQPWLLAPTEPFFGDDRTHLWLWSLRRNECAGTRMGEAPNCLMRSSLVHLWRLVIARAQAETQPSCLGIGQ